MGAFGRRYATLESTGDWREIGDDLSMEALTGAGLFGKATSGAIGLVPLTYKGHVLVEVPASPRRPSLARD